jgi:hypothetical protein
MLSLDLTRQLGEVRVIPRSRSTWELLEIALAGGADPEVSWAQGAMKASMLTPAGVSP